MKKSNRLDLHNTKHEDVNGKVVRFLNDNLCPDGYVYEELDIITGNSLTMKEIVCKILDEHMLYYEINGIMGINTGYISVYTSN